MVRVVNNAVGVRAAIRAVRASRRFARDEDGGLIWFALILGIGMVLIGGMAVDMMRFERTRVALQQTIDRATLAAASLDQPLDAEDVVIDYFAKAGLAEKLESVNLDEGLNFKTVTADASALSPNFFMDFLGYDEFVAPAHSVAEQRITNVEVVLVLDISGSMAGNNKLTNLKKAATGFVDLILERDVEDRISIGIVPYNAHVNLGPDLMSKYQVTNTHNYPDSFCIDLPEGTGTTTFTNLVIPRDVDYPQAPFADALSSTSGVNNYVNIQGPQKSNGLYPLVRCQPNSATYVRLPNNDPVVLKQQINALVANGNTSIDLGFRWGVSMIDPSFRSIISEEVEAGRVPEAFAGRPFEYNDDDSIKVIVLMTDGEHVTSEYFQTAYRGNAMSPIYRLPNGNLVRQDPFKLLPDLTPDPNNIWDPSFNANPGDGVSEGQWRSVFYPQDPDAVAVRLTWHEVWSTARVPWVAWQLYARALGTNSTTRNQQYTAAMNSFLVNPNISTSARDARLDQLCEVVKAQDVKIYGIAFEASQRAQNVIRGCSSSDGEDNNNFFYNSVGGEIVTDFRLIAANISQLRLTQ